MEVEGLGDPLLTYGVPPFFQSGLSLPYIAAAATAPMVKASLAAQFEQKKTEFAWRKENLDKQFFDGKIPKKILEYRQKNQQQN